MLRKVFVALISILFLSGIGIVAFPMSIYESVSVSTMDIYPVDMDTTIILLSIGVLGLGSISRKRDIDP